MPINQKLRRKLLTMARADQTMRAGKKPWRKKADVHRVHQLEQLIVRYGWPDEAKVKEDGAHAAWLIAQHADYDAALQAKFLKLLKVKVKQKKVPYWQRAYLADRVRVNKGRKQRYGTQFRINKSGRLVMQPVLNRRRLDVRRKQVGLEPIALYRNKLRLKQSALKRRR